MRTFPVLAGGKLDRLDPRTGKSDLIALGPAAAPHGVIVAPDSAAWVIEGGQNAIARIDRATRAVKLFPLPKERRDANLNTASFDRQGVLWFTGQNGISGRLDPKRALWRYSTRRAALALTTSPPRRMARCSSPRSPATISAKSILRRAPPRSWSRPCHVRARGGSGAALWITGWRSGDLFRYDSKLKTWARWHLPGDGPRPHAVYVDETDAVWVSDQGAIAILPFDPKTEKFDSFPLPDRYAGVRLQGRKGEVWGAESGADKLFVLKTE